MKQNPMLAKIHAKHQAELDYCCRFTVQFAKDIAMVAVNRAFHAGPVGSERFSECFDEILAEYRDMLLSDTPDVDYSKYKLDQALEPIMGENFVPYTVRYGVRKNDR